MKPFVAPIKIVYKDNKFDKVLSDLDNGHIVSADICIRRNQFAFLRIYKNANGIYLSFCPSCSTCADYFDYCEFERHNKISNDGGWA
jgi:hypothetical protein